VQERLLHFVPLSGSVSDYKLGIVVSAHKNLPTVVKLFADTIEKRFRLIEFT
jgi:hypothetical protein